MHKEKWLPNIKQKGKIRHPNFQPRNPMFSKYNKQTDLIVCNWHLFKKQDKIETIRVDCAHYRFRFAKLFFQFTYIYLFHTQVHTCTHRAIHLWNLDIDSYYGLQSKNLKTLHFTLPVLKYFLVFLCKYCNSNIKNINGWVILP